MNGANENPNTVTTIHPNLNRFAIEKEYHAVLTPSVVETEKQYTLSK